MAPCQVGPALVVYGTYRRTREGAEEPEAVRGYLSRFSWQGIHRVHADKVALRQRRATHRLGENDAWQVAMAEQMDAILVGHDQSAFQRLGAAYDDHHRGVTRR